MCVGIGGGGGRLIFLFWLLGQNPRFLAVAMVFWLFRVLAFFGFWLFRVLAFFGFWLFGFLAFGFWLLAFGKIGFWLLAFGKSVFGFWLLCFFGFFVLFGFWFFGFWVFLCFLVFWFFWLWLFGFWQIGKMWGVGAGLGGPEAARVCGSEGRFGYCPPPHKLDNLIPDSNG